MKVYLSGGMGSKWQDFFHRHLIPEVLYIDPSKHDLSDPNQYTFSDLAGVRACDVLLAFLEETNPSGIGLALEVGYAKGLGKVVIFVNEKSDKRFDIVTCTADLVVKDLEEAWRVLKAMSKTGV